jgi:hypothetical protein
MVPADGRYLTGTRRLWWDVKTRKKDKVSGVGSIARSSWDVYEGKVGITGRAVALFCG